MDALKGCGLVELMLEGNPFKERLDPKVYVRYGTQANSHGNNGQTLQPHQPHAKLGRRRMRGGKAFDQHHRCGVG